MPLPKSYPTIAGFVNAPKTLSEIALVLVNNPVQVVVAISI